MAKKYIKGLVSVIIPTYKRSDVLKRAINSVANQTYSNIEILVVDDNEPGSEYSCLVKEVVDNFKLKNLFLITQDRHINGAVARNVGIRRARGEFIAFLDDDDLWLPEKIAKQVNFINSCDSSVGGVSTRKIYYINGKPDHISEFWKADKSQNYKVISRQQNLSTCTLLLRHEYLDTTGYFDETLRRHQEVQLMSYFTSKYRVELLDEILTVFDCSDVSNRPDARKLIIIKQDFFRAIDPIMQTYSKHKQNLIIAHHMTEVAYALYRDENKLNGIIRLLGCLIYPSVAISFVMKYFEKINNRRKIRLLSPSILMKITRLVNNLER